jgi:hypothetical protein
LKFLMVKKVNFLSTIADYGFLGHLISCNGPN